MSVLVITGLLLAVGIILSVAEMVLVSYGECTVKLNSDRSFSVTGGDDLLSCLTENRVFIPSACGGKGTCGLCKVKVLSGGGRLLPTEELFLDEEEQRQGVRLACQLKVRRDLEIRVPEHLMQADEFETEVASIDRLTGDTELFRLRNLNPRAMEFRPGQFVQFKIPGTDEYRAYSIASPPSLKHHTEFVVRLVPGGLCSTYMHRALQAGDRVYFRGPFGEFYLQEDSPRDIIAIAGGCGLAPMRSIINHLAEQGMPRKLTYFFGARTKTDLLFADELGELAREFPNFRYLPALSNPTPADKWDGEVGLVTQVAEKHLDEASEKEAYLCGPPPMIDAAVRMLARNGVDPDRIHYDKF